MAGDRFAVDLPGYVRQPRDFIGDLPGDAKTGCLDVLRPRACAISGKDSIIGSRLS